MRLFAYRLAYKLGLVNVDEMLDRISPAQMAEWIAAFNLGIDPDSWAMAGTIAATIHNEIRSALFSYAGKQMPKSEIHYPDKYNPFTARQSKKRKYDPESIRRYQRYATRRYGNHR